jgi:hypothetical protein
MKLKSYTQFIKENADLVGYGREYFDDGSELTDKSNLSEYIIKLFDKDLNKFLEEYEENKAEWDAKINDVLGDTKIQFIKDSLKDIDKLKRLHNDSDIYIFFERNGKVGKSKDDHLLLKLDHTLKTHSKANLMRMKTIFPGTPGMRGLSVYQIILPKGTDFQSMSDEEILSKAKLWSGGATLWASGISDSRIKVPLPAAYQKNNKNK